MPTMPVAAFTAPDDCYFAASASPSSKRHPHPLRSHSTENLHNRTKSSLSRRTSQSSQCSFQTLKSKRGSIYGSGGDGSYDILEDYPVSPPLPSPVHPAFHNSVTTTERFGDAAGCGPPSPSKGYPVVASRPPLRPTVSFGGESRMSYYSLASSTLDQKSKAIAAEEHSQQQRRREKSNCAGTLFSCCGITCLQRRKPLTISLPVKPTTASLPAMAELPG